MVIEPFRREDIDPFLSLAAGESWICDRWELEFLLSEFREGCFVCRTDDGPVGFVTSLRHDRSGWVGNLLVAPRFRGGGIGRKLMGQALHALKQASVETVWLTASEQGRPIYEQLGFLAIDTIKRWVGRGSGDGGAVELPVTTAVSGKCVEIDCQGWGDTRQALLEAVVRRGSLVEGSDAFLVEQFGSGGVQIGPWGGSNRLEAEKLLKTAIAGIEVSRKVFVDVPVRNIAASAMLYANGFDVAGSNRLMFLGRSPDYNPEMVYALASMGSMG